MHFINAEIDVATLPAAASMELQTVEKRYLTLLRLKWVISWALVLLVAALLVFFVDELRELWWWPAVLLAVVVISILRYVVLRKSFRFLAYAVRQHDVTFQKGWLVRQTKTCPYNRIQNCSIEAGLLERHWQLASLVLYTAGSDGADVRIPGLSQTTAEELREFILTKINDHTQG